MSNYVEELIQVAAVAIAAVQAHETNSTGLTGEGSWFNKYGERIYAERLRQEALRVKHGWNERSPRYFAVVLMEEIGESAKAILEEGL